MKKVFTLSVYYSLKKNLKVYDLIDCLSKNLIAHFV